jgi:hypothetical protein
MVPVGTGMRAPFLGLADDEVADCDGDWFLLTLDPGTPK